MLRLDRIESEFLRRYPVRSVTIDSHTQGEPTRLLVGGTPPLPGRTINAKRQYFESRYDHLRKLLTREPRGHSAIMAAVATEPVTPRGNFGLFFMDSRRYLHLCGHATIGAVVSLIETGALQVAGNDPIIIVDTPSGPLEAHTRIRGGRVESVALEMVPSFVLATDREITLEDLGTIPVHLVCVGGFFAMVSAPAVGIDLIPQNSRRLIRLGMAIIDAANRTLRVFHPERPEVGTVDAVEFYDEDPQTGMGRGLVVYGESHMDRSPCGTGTAAKLTLLHHRGQLAVGDRYQNSSPLGTSFSGRIVSAQPIGNIEGIVARVRGTAQITGLHQFVLDPVDPFPTGFIV